MDLETLQSQMKVVIQKHQIVVTEMRKDPQNSVLQKQLKDLNSEIMSLSEKQKQIMQQLRNNLRKKQSPLTVVPANQVSIQPNLYSQNSLQAQEVRMVCSAQKPLMNHRLTTPVQTVTLAPKQVPNFVNSLHQPVPSTVSNLVTSTGTLTFKGPMGTVVLPNCSGTTALLANKSVDHQKLHPVLVVPTPANRGMEGSQTGVLLNLVPPIRVPQYPPASRPPGTVLPQKAQNPPNCFVPANVTSATVTCVPSPKVASPIVEKSFNSSPLPCSASSSVQVYHQLDKPAVIKIDPEKKEFMVALGLISKDTLHDLKNKKAERKRRSTANPQFSNAALEEKWRNAAAAQALGPPVKRPRGRPRLESKLASASTNGICPVPSDASDSSRNGSPTGAAGRHAATTTATTTTTAAAAAAAVPTPSVLNGIHRQISPAEEKKVEQLLSNLCIVCTQPGDLVKCDSCAKQQHLACMQPPLPVRPEGQWQCSDCQSRADSLTAVHSYDVLKAAKEDEKRKLLKKSLELRLKRSQLEGKLYQLKDLASKQKDRQSELQMSLKKIEGTMELFQNIVASIRQYS